MNKGLPYDPLKSMMNGAGTTCFSSINEPVGGTEGDVIAAIEHAQQTTAQAVANITAYSASKLGSVMGELISPPMPQDILGKSAALVSAYIISPGEIMNEILTPCEDFDDKINDEKLKKALDDYNKFKDEKVGKLKNDIQKVTDVITVEIPKITNYAKQGITWVDEQVKFFEEKAKAEINKTVDEQTAFLFDRKEKAINSLATGLAQRTANIANEKVRKETKRKLDKIKEVKEHAIIKAKAMAGKVLLNLMALLGL